MGDSREQERRDNSQHQDNTNMPNFSQIWKVVITFFSTILSSFLYIATQPSSAVPFAPTSRGPRSYNKQIDPGGWNGPQRGCYSQITFPSGRHNDSIRLRFISNWSTSAHERGLR
jgi:hypothetical protein